MALERIKMPLLIILFGLGLGVIGDLLFYEKPLGISAPIFTAAILVALLVLVVAERTAVTWENSWLAAPILFFAVMYAVRASPTVRFWNFAAALALLALLSNRLAGEPLIKLNLAGYLGVVLESSVVSAFLAAPLIQKGWAALSSTSQGGGRRTARRVFVGALIALPFLCVFTILFAAADLVFGQYVADVLRLFEDLPDLIGQILFTLALAWVLIGGLAYALSRMTESRTIFERPMVINDRADAAQPAAGSEQANDEDAAREVEEAVPQPAPSRGIRELLGHVEVAVVLFSVDALFFVFVVIQFAALFGGETFLRAHALTYSEYARRGFFELLTVSLITLGLVLSLDFVTRRETPAQANVFLIGSGLMIGMVVIILASAFYRMALYELAYGFTRLRVHTHVFMIWLAILFSAFLWMLVVGRTRWFAHGVLIVSIGALATLNLLNPDAFIARQNIARYQRGEELDVAYLGALSADTAPMLFSLLLDAPDPDIREEAGEWLHFQLNRLDRRQEQAGWPSYHFSINRAYRMLDLNRGLIETYDAPERGWYID